MAVEATGELRSTGNGLPCVEGVEKGAEDRGPGKTNPQRGAWEGGQEGVIRGQEQSLGGEDGEASGASHVGCHAEAKKQRLRGDSFWGLAQGRG